MKRKNEKSEAVKLMLSATLEEYIMYIQKMAPTLS
jgi:hypothetical protein